LKARTKSSDGVELTADYYFQKVVKDREEVQRKGIELEKRFIKVSHQDHRTKSSILQKT
jgi:hypothetical protein